VLSVRRRTEVDLSTVVGWIPDAGALYFFTGPRLVWPLTIEQLAAMDADESLTAWMVLDERAQPVGHFDLTVVDRIARYTYALREAGGSWRISEKIVHLINDRVPTVLDFYSI